MCPVCGLEPMRGMDPEYCEHAVFNWWVDEEVGWGDQSDPGDQARVASGDLRAALDDLLLTVFGASHPDAAGEGVAGWRTPAEATKCLSAVEVNWPGPLPGWWTEIRESILDEAEFFDLDPESGEPTGWTGHFTDRLEMKLMIACVASVKGVVCSGEDFFFAKDPDPARAGIASAIELAASKLQLAVDRCRGPRHEDQTQ